MNIIIKGRRAGKTTDLIKLSAETGQYILVADFERARSVADLARKLKLKIPYPVTILEAQKYGFQDTFIRTILVDDADDVLQRILGVQIAAMTLTKDEVEP